MSKIQVNARFPKKLADAWRKAAGGVTGDEQSLPEWMQDACEHWRALAEEGRLTKPARRPQEVAALMQADHVVVDALVAELQAVAATRNLNAEEGALLRRLDPAAWRALAGVPR